MKTAAEARSFAVRRIIAKQCDRSTGGTTEHTKVVLLDLLHADRDEISWRIQQELGVKIDEREWAHFRTVGDIINFVEAATQQQKASVE